MECELCIDNPSLEFPPHDPYAHFNCGWDLVLSRRLTKEERKYMVDCDWAGPNGLELLTQRLPADVHVVAMRRIREPA